MISNLRNGSVVGLVQLLELPHPDVVDLDGVVGRGHADAGTAGVEVEVVGEALRLLEDVDLFSAGRVEESDGSVV